MKSFFYHFFSAQQNVLGTDISEQVADDQTKKVEEELNGNISMMTEGKSEQKYTSLFFVYVEIEYILYHLIYFSVRRKNLVYLILLGHINQTT